MRILYFSHGYPPTVSGVSLVVQKLARALVERGHQVQVVTASETGRPYHSVDAGVHLARVRGLPNAFWREGPLPIISIAQVRRMMAEFHPDIVHTHENVLLSNQLLRAAPGEFPPLVSSCYFLPQYITHYVGARPVNRLIEKLVWAYIIGNLNNFRQVVFSTRSQQQAFIRQGLHAPSLAISNGVDATRYFPGQAGVSAVTRRYELPPGPRILFVSRLMKDKRIDLLIEAFARLEGSPAAHLLIVGRGPEQANLASLAQQLGVGDRVHFLGFIPENDLPAIYRASQVFAMASNVEVQSIPTLQALSSGLPVALVDAAALPELVIDGVNGRLVAPHEPPALAAALQHILADPGRAAGYGRASLKVAAAHSEPATYQAYEDLYLRTISQS